LAGAAHGSSLLASRRKQKSGVREVRTGEKGKFRWCPVVPHNLLCWFVLQLQSLGWSSHPHVFATARCAQTQTTWVDSCCHVLWQFDAISRCM
jgi:hypothetical protein